MIGFTPFDRATFLTHLGGTVTRADGATIRGIVKGESVITAGGQPVYSGESVQRVLWVDPSAPRLDDYETLTIDGASWRVAEGSARILPNSGFVQYTLTPG